MMEYDALIHCHFDTQQSKKKIIYRYSLKYILLNVFDIHHIFYYPLKLKKKNLDESIFVQITLKKSFSLYFRYISYYVPNFMIITLLLPW
jgi:NADH:ubiquinone oxidoreductase subunit 3 (subunit A)